ncbi:MAG: Na-translocating system protein MpsC family protein [Clostridiales bacterium]|nr:Na-translocating system protein MpsC family protein [Clostridiales bacterium]MDD7036260.1 Na-translocating system protein MpsC family protein [Bacillota bacterium]MDY2921130.1 Na-translocating system protein MpsC family protein [Lentihominibacter sp.]
MSDSLYLRRMKVMCVEDDETAREALVSVLKRRSGRVFAGADGREGLELYRKHKPDIILVDMLMPNMSGTELIENIRRECGDEKLAVIVISALTDSGSIINAVDAGIDKYITKPVDIDELLTTLEEQAEAIYHQKYKADSLTEENPRAKEDEIKRGFAALLKKMTGKGPRNVNVSVGCSSIEVAASEVLTTMERTLYDKSKNIGVIKYTREVFFYSLEDEYCDMIYSAMGRRYRMDKVLVNPEKDRLKLIFEEVRAG